MNRAGNYALSVLLLPLIAAGFLFELGRLGFAGGRGYAHRLARKLLLL